MKTIKKEGAKLATDIDKLQLEIKRSIEMMQDGGHEIILETALDFHLFRESGIKLKGVKMTPMANGSIVI